MYKKIQTITHIVVLPLLLLVIVGSLSLSVRSVVTAAPPTPPTDKPENSDSSSNAPDPEETTFNSYNPNEEYDCPQGTAVKECVKGNPIVKIVNTGINLFSIMAGIAIVAGVVAGGVKYSSSGGDPSKVASAKKMIGAAIGGLLAFVLLRAFIEYIQP